MYIIGQTRKHRKKDGTEVEYGPYYWLVKAIWTANGPRIKKLRYLGKNPSSVLIQYTSEVNQSQDCFNLFDPEHSRCKNCIHAEFCDVYESHQLNKGMVSEI